MNTSDKTYDLFLSYGRGDDIPFTKQLYADLKEQGYKVWFDAEDLESNGLSFLQSIRDSLATNPMRLLLVVGPHSSKSDYVKTEWEFALANCMVVIPILRMGNEKDENGLPKMSDKDYGFIPEPVSKRKLDCINFRRERAYEEALKELLQDLSSPILPLCKLYSVPNKPANFIARNNEVEKIKEIVMGDNYKPGVITSVGKSTAVQGMGGIGKSVLAASVCHDCDVKRSFSDGVYWITIGQQQPELNVTKAIQLLTGDDKINLRDNNEEAKNKLRESLQQKNCLIVLDDVWQQQDIQIFPSDEALRCRLLITTRNKQTVQNLAAKIVEIDLLNNDDARSLLAKAASGSDETKKYTVEKLPNEANAIIKECGNLPFAIDMAGGMICAGDTGRWNDVLQALQEADLAYIEQQFPDYPYPNLFKVLDVSVVSLEEPTNSKYRQLAVFPRDAGIPKEIIHTLWKKDGESERHTNKLLDELVARSLIQRTNDGFYSLHDLQVDYLKTTSTNLKVLNKGLISRLGDPLHLSNEYAWNNYIWHLKEAGEIETATKLLQTYEWIEAKLFASDINELLKDYELFDGFEKEIELIYNTLKLSAYILAEDKNQLAVNVIGRLGNFESQLIAEFVEKAQKYDKKPWLKPVISSMNPAIFVG